MTLKSTAATTYFTTLWHREFAAADENFVVIVEKQYRRENRHAEPTGSMRVTVAPADWVAGVANNSRNISAMMPQGAAHDFVMSIIRDENRLFWYVQDIISYAAKYGNW